MPDAAPRRRRASRRSSRCGSTRGEGNYPVWDAQRGVGHARAATRSPTQARGAERAKIGEAHRVHGAVRRDARRRRRAPAPGRAVRRPRATRGGPDQGAVPLGGQVLRAGRRGLLGRRHDLHQARLARGGHGAATRRRLGDLRHAARVLVRGRWGSSTRSGTRRTRPSTGADPFTTAVDWHGVVTHGHLPENDHHGGMPLPSLGDPLRALSGAPASSVPHRELHLRPRRLRRQRRRTACRRPCKQGSSLTFRNLDSPRGGTRRARSTTPSRAAGRRAPARRASPTRWRTVP